MFINNHIASNSLSQLQHVTAVLFGLQYDVAASANAVEGAADYSADR